jgi:hypothetical protein
MIGDERLLPRPFRATPSWPGLSRPSTTFLLNGQDQVVDARDKRGHDAVAIMVDA